MPRRITRRAAKRYKQKARQQGRVVSFKGKKRQKYQSFISPYQNTGPQCKVADHNWTKYAVNNGGHANRLNYITKGTGRQNRVGNRITMKSIEIRGHLNLSGNNSILPNEIVRILVVYDKQSNNTTPAYSSIIENLSNTSITESTTIGFPNMNNSERFEILKDYIFDCPDAQTSSTALTPINTALIDFSRPGYFHWKIPLEGRETIFSGTTVGNELQSGTLWLWVMGDSFPGSEPYELTFNARLEFVDGAYGNDNFPGMYKGMNVGPNNRTEEPWELPEGWIKHAWEGSKLMGRLGRHAISDRASLWSQYAGTAMSTTATVFLGELWNRFLHRHLDQILANMNI